MRPDAPVAALASRIAATPYNHRRRLIALAGPPGSGKSTFADSLTAQVPHSCVVPMDGFHLDNRLLEERDLLARKGAPDTFDVVGFQHLLARLQKEAEVIYPVFDRASEQAIAGAAVVGPEVETVILEGNYLLLDAPKWRELAPLWDLSVYLSVPEDILHARLLARWLSHGFSLEDATHKAEANDLPNARTTAAHLLTPDVVLDDTAPS